MTYLLYYIRVRMQLAHIYKRIHYDPPLYTCHLGSTLHQIRLNN